MNKIKQLWTLFKFQATFNPSIWFMALSFTGSCWVPLLHSSPLPLSSRLVNYQLFMIGFISMMVLAPNLASATAQNAWSSGTEFLLTRATDRSLVYRAKSIFLYALILLVPCVFLLFSLTESAFKITEYSNSFRHELITKLPGTTFSKDRYGSVNQLTIPNGEMLISSWNTWTLLVTALASKIFIWIIYPLKFRRYLLYGIFAVFMSGNFILIAYSPDGPHQLNVESLFLLFATHQTLVWVSTLLAAILSQLGANGVLHGWNIDRWSNRWLRALDSLINH